MATRSCKLGMLGGEGLSVCPDVVVAGHNVVGARPDRGIESLAVEELESCDGGVQVATCRTCGACGRVEGTPTGRIVMNTPRVRVPPRGKGGERRDGKELWSGAVLEKVVQRSLAWIIVAHVAAPSRNCHHRAYDREAYENGAACELRVGHHGREANDAVLERLPLLSPNLTCPPT